jgi:hypothetical protein
MEISSGDRIKEIVKTPFITVLVTQRDPINILSTSIKKLKA